jgi:hypothetical protein
MSTDDDNSTDGNGTSDATNELNRPDGKPSDDELVNVSGGDVPPSVREPTDGGEPGPPVPMTDLPRVGSTRLSDLVSDRSDIPPLREEFFKPSAELARRVGYDVTIKDLTALAPDNSPLYIYESNYRDAEWFARLYASLDPDDVPHTRALHYRLLGTEVVVPSGDGDPEPYSSTAWGTFSPSSKYARILGVVDPGKIKDAKNDPPAGPVSVEETGGRYRESPSLPSDREPNRRPYVSPPKIEYNSPSTAPTVPLPSVHRSALISVDQHIGDWIDTITRRVFGGTRYVAPRHQQYYVELWAEKSGVVPSAIPEKWPITVREADGGQMSEDMARWAVQIAKQREQDLVIVLLTDLDGQGADMPAAVSVKVWLEAALDESAAGSFGPPCEAIVEHAAVRPEQATEFDLPEAPVESTNKSYSGHAALLNNRQIEVNSFQELHPAAYRKAIEAKIEPYLDLELQDSLDETVTTAKRELKNELAAEYDDEVRSEIGDARDEADDALGEYYDHIEEATDEYHDRLEEANEIIQEATETFEEQERHAREEAGVDQAIEAFRESVTSADHEAVSEGIEVDLPDPNVDGGINDSHGPPVLDTHRTIGLQLDVFRWYDPRFVSDG